MFTIKSLTLLTTALCALLCSARPAPQGTTPPTGPGGYWLANVDHSKDTVWDPDAEGAPAANYQIFRNVLEYGAVGDGKTDDTAAINKAMSDGERCGGGPDTPCDSTTVYPAIVYFPPGNYLVSKPIEMYYYTQMIGDATDLPTISASSDFDGMAVIDADPYAYLSNGSAVNWFTNQNNFFRQVRNFKIDITQWGGGLSGAGIHWQVAQATSLQNIVFEMSDNPATAQVGIFMDNGSGGFMADLVFNNGGKCAFFGSQQFTTRNMTFNNCQTAVYMNWNWGWTLQGLTVNGGGTGLDMSVNPTNQSVGSVLLADTVMKDVEYGVRFAYQNDSSNFYPTGGSLILDNVDMSGVTTASVVDYNNNTVLEPMKVQTWASGNGYHATRQGTDTTLQGSKQENAIIAPRKAPSLLDSNGNIFTQSRPQYETMPASSFLSAKQNGCAGDGSTDDTAAIVNLLKMSASQNKVAYFEHGAYLVKNTVLVPPGAKMTGEIWPLILADGQSFSNTKQPKPVFQVGKAGGEQGSFQISDFVFETLGPASGAIMIEWNMQSPQGESGMWDTHVRIGGSAGTDLQGPPAYGNCRKNPESTQVNLQCEGVFMMFHATRPSSGIYLENTWFWVADHDLDHETPQQISLYSARGALIQSEGPIWMWGTASEHSIFYQYQIDGAQAVFSGFMQSETPYMQPNPLAPAPFTVNTAYDDPQFAICGSGTDGSPIPCKDAWGLRIVNSRNVLIYGTGLYSFFNNYDQDCVGTHNCQQHMVHIQNSQVSMYTVNTANSVSMIVDDNMGTVAGEDNRNWFCDTVSYYFTPQ
ncbi:uncharacterized protein LTR77_009786 [Saxophila tyrrhenica]|uniref:Rhamnogalacturonase A/B/Epimerase-like pectate lyase domain-containing protein n=1 Tax=Saxophila tyrrhenica TaxID=1690608 RepID=A0AAV9P146_9PEZI|nr:hypothetical protein LTR77_009786 [Saxophila tyrrhenica]